MRIKNNIRLKSFHENLCLKQSHLASALDQSDPIILACPVHSNLYYILLILPSDFRGKILNLLLWGL